MLFENRKAGLDSKIKFIKKSDAEKVINFDEHSKKYCYDDNLNLRINFGQFFLFEEETKIIMSGNTIDTKVIMYPKIGLCVGIKLYDMALAIEYIPVPRIWDKWNSYKNENGNECGYFEEFPVINNIIHWYDTSYIYGIWDSIPNWKELKKCYKNTIYYSRTLQEERDISLNSILDD